MKKLILLFLVLVLKFAPAKAQWVTIPDANFVTWLNTNYPSCMNGNQMDTTCAGIVNATSLNINYTFISNLFGLQFFDNLTSLNCYQNQSDCSSQKTSDKMNDKVCTYSRGNRATDKDASWSDNQKKFR
jgi:hypothetical protein